MRTETVEIDDRFGEEYAGKYIFQEISWAKRSRIIQKHTKYHPITGDVISSDYVAIQAETIWASLKEQPESKPITLERLLSEEDGVPTALGELLAKTANRLCGVTVDEIRFLSESCDEAGHTQLSRCSVSVRSSGGHHASSRGSQPRPSKGSS